MAQKRIETLIAPTRDAHSNWHANNPILPEGVMGVTKGRLGDNSVEFFVGDGVKNYDSLPKSGDLPQYALKTELAQSNSTIDTHSKQITGLYEGKDLAVAFESEISDYSDVWAWVKSRVLTGNYDGLCIGDYISFQMGSDTIVAEIAGMDTYRASGYPEIGHHIDFISRDCRNAYVQWNTTVTNQGTAEQPFPWLASNIYKVLNETWYNELPAALKNQIITKRALLEQRYSASSSLEASTTWEWADMGKLWLPSETEVYGQCVWGTKGYSVAAFIQYPLFALNMKHRIKGKGHNGSRASWWLCTPSGVSSVYVASVYSDGYAYSYSASISGVCAPLCFRIG